jgi:hypothetical protein
MGVVPSIAQKIADKIEINVEKAVVSNVQVSAREPLVGQVDGIVDVTNHDAKAVDAVMKPARVYLEMPVVPGSEAVAGVFGYYELPKIKIGLGSKSHKYSSPFTITSKAKYLAWAAAMASNPGVDLNIHVKPMVSVAVVDPVKYLLNVDKHIVCNPETSAVNAPATGHYGQPPCQADEAEVWDGQTVICAAGCDGSKSNCPADVAESLSPKFGISCNDTAPAFPHGTCLFHCLQDSDCGGSAMCLVDGPTQLGFCTYATNATPPVTTTYTTTSYPLPVNFGMSCNFVGNAPHIEAPSDEVIV